MRKARNCWREFLLFPKAIGIFGVLVFVTSAGVVLGASIVGSQHDFSTGGVDPYSDQPCVFCHTPHFANSSLPIQAPLWNRFIDTNQTFTVYSSSSMDTTPGNPNTTVSLLCLGCHDGTNGSAVVSGITGSTKHDLVNAPGPGGIPDTTSYPNCRNCHPEIYGDPPAYWSGTDLSNEHPIAMGYPTIAIDPAFNTPPNLIDGWPLVPLYAGRVECPTCHDVHDPANIPFLRMPNTSSQLCITCHLK
ncbi:MAG: hypothetical protein K8R59_01175 [Thermoanaerobaculales bacterium]|nr:hypothetical protein [Thermoanaerobaculales bacterium]